MNEYKYAVGPQFEEEYYAEPNIEEISPLDLYAWLGPEADQQDEYAMARRLNYLLHQQGYYTERDMIELTLSGEYDILNGAIRKIIEPGTELEYDLTYILKEAKDMLRNDVYEVTELVTHEPFLEVIKENKLDAAMPIEDLRSLNIVL